ncbi:MAG: DNA-3-methyladenine glycosylase 2 family protein [Bacteroidales bacterium]|jgi:DNA-3-methyladenine glycosylase II|nr:DNA-3-methyladenine glycosylase 2 family protein [Bacteroidales bacterium]
MKSKKTLCRDLVIKELIEKYGELTLAESSNNFTDLVRSIVAQQLSGKAANTIWKRVETLLNGEITADKFLSVSDDLIRQTGVSSNKTRYIKNIAQAVFDQSLDLKNLRNYDNEEIIRQLTMIKGVGQWTAEMFLIFSLAREDVFSFGDGGLNSAINKLYGSGVVLTKDEIKTITEKWKPYRSIASLYLWQSLDNK